MQLCWWRYIGSNIQLRLTILICYPFSPVAFTNPCPVTTNIVQCWCTLLGNEAKCKGHTIAYSAIPRILASIVFPYFVRRDVQPAKPATLSEGVTIIPLSTSNQPSSTNNPMFTSQLQHLQEPPCLPYTQPIDPTITSQDITIIVKDSSTSHLKSITNSIPWSFFLDIWLIRVIHFDLLWDQSSWLQNQFFPWHLLAREY